MFLPLNKQCIYHKYKGNNKKERLIVKCDVLKLSQFELITNFYKVTHGRYKHTYRKKKHHIRQTYKEKLKNMSEGKKRRYYRRMKKRLAEKLKDMMLEPDPGTSVDCYEINMSDNSFDCTEGSECLIPMIQGAEKTNTLTEWMEATRFNDKRPVRDYDAMSRTHLLGVGPAYSMHTGGDGPITPPRRAEETSEEEKVYINSLIVADEVPGPDDSSELSELPDLDDAYMMAMQLQG